MQQRSPEWYAARLGHVTASRIPDVMATIKTGEAIVRRNYRAEKVLERLFARPQDRGYVSPAMHDGIEWEEQARAAYVMESGEDVEEVGFIVHPDIPFAGASPDGITLHGTLEIKCPEPSAYLAAYMGEDVPTKYLQQMQFALACTGRAYADYCVYRPGCKLIVQRIARDDSMIETIEAEVRKFLAEVEDALNTALVRS